MLSSSLPEGKSCLNQKTQVHQVISIYVLALSYMCDLNWGLLKAFFLSPDG